MPDPDPLTPIPLYAYLVHGTGFSVLLNRPGRTLSAPDGASGSIMSIVLDDDAAVDIHTTIPMSGDASGTFQPDGRITDPLSVLDTDARPSMLDSFVGLDPNGTWTLFVADQSPGAASTLNSWTLNLTIGIPEPSRASFLALALAAALLRRRRR